MSRHRCHSVKGVLVAVLRSEEPSVFDMAFGPGMLVPTVCAEECDHSETMCVECVDSWAQEWVFDGVGSKSFPLMYPN